MYLVIFILCYNTECNKSPDTQFKASTLSCIYIKPTHHRIMQLRYINGLVLDSIHAKDNWKNLIFDPISNFRFPHMGIN